MTGDMRLRLGGNVIAKDLVDVPVGREEVLPYLAGCALRLLIDELDASAEQSSVGNCKVVDFKGDDRTASEEIVVFVELTIDVYFGPILQPESARFVVDRQNV